MYFLNEIQNDAFGYVNYAKNVVKDNIIAFFGEKYRNTINEHFHNNNLVLLNRGKRDFNNTMLYLDNEKFELMLQFFYEYRNMIKENLTLREITRIFAENNLNNYFYDFNYCLDEIKNKFSELFNDNILNDDKLLKLSFRKLQKSWILNFNDRYDAIQRTYFFAKSQETYDVDVTFELSSNPYYRNLARELKPLCFDKIVSFIRSNDIIGECVPLNVHGKFKTVCLFPSAKNIESHLFVHEYLHVASTYISYREGLDLKTSGVGIPQSLSFNCDGVDLLYINEVLTDYFAKKICDNSRETKNVDCSKLFYDYEGVSLYEECFILIKPFLEKYLERLKKYYISADQKGFLRFFGEENIIKLNDLLIDFTSYVNTLLEDKEVHKKDIIFATSFEEGIKLFSTVKDYKGNYELYKYYQCFSEMNDLLLNIETELSKKTNKNDKIFTKS